MQTFVTEAVDWPDNAAALRDQVRALVAEHGESDPVRRANSWTKPDPAFSRILGEAGLLGMTWPKEYGGHERSQLERYVVIEELLAAGAPVGAHWIADRQSGPLLLRLGNEELKRRWVPAIARGEAFACIGLSEPGSGSDLASVRTTARRDGSDWVIDGQKVWTSGAHVSHFMIALVRSEAGSERQQGLSQFVIPMDTPGVTVKPITDLTGAHDDAVQPPHFMVKQTHRVLGVVVRTEAVRADQFGEAIGLVCRRHLAAAAHFRQFHAEAALRELPGGFAASEAAADYVDIMGHRARPSACIGASTRPSVFRCLIALSSSTAPGCSRASSRG